MSRNINFATTYYDFPGSLTGISDDYVSSYDKDYISFYNTSFDIKTILPTEIDIFSNLPKEIYQSERVKKFLNEMEKCLANLYRSEVIGVVLPKLYLSEYTSKNIVIEWIFNYFRIFFSFDEDEGDYFGETSINSDKDIYRNNFRRMTEKEYSLVAESQIEYAIMMCSGGDADEFSK